MMRAIALVEETADGFPRAVDTPELLETKLFLPRFHSRQVTRPHLVTRIEEGVQGRLALISAPAGFGKTTLIADWVATSQRGERTAWFSIDKGDNDSVLFWSYVIRALQKLDPEVGRRALWLLQSAHSPPVDSVLRGLINDLSQDGPDLALVLDGGGIIRPTARG